MKVIPTNVTTYFMYAPKQSLVGQLVKMAVGGLYTRQICLPYQLYSHLLFALTIIFYVHSSNTSLLT